MKHPPWFLRFAFIGFACVCLGVTAPAAVVAQTALTVDFYALQRVNLATHEAVVIAELGTADPPFSCQSLAVSDSGEIRCAAAGMLYEIAPGSATPLAALPAVGSGYMGLAFDAQGRLWFTSRAAANLWQLDPATGAVLDTQPLTLVSEETYALAALDDRLFVLTKNVLGSATLLEEVDPTTGASLSAVEVGALGIGLPVDAAFDGNGDLWVVDYEGEIVLGANVYSYNRIQLLPLTVTETWSGVVLIHSEPTFGNIDAVASESTLVDVPILGPIGELLLMLSLLSAGGMILRGRAV